MPERIGVVQIAGLIARRHRLAGSGDGQEVGAGERIGHDPFLARAVDVYLPARQRGRWYPRGRPRWRAKTVIARNCVPARTGPSFRVG